MSYTDYSPEEISKLGRSLYEEKIRSKVEDAFAGRFLVLDVQSGDYEIAPDDLEASDRLLAQRPDAVLYGLRIGEKAAYRLGTAKLSPPSLSK